MTMEKRKESLCLLRRCRFCLTQDGILNNLYSTENSEDSIPLSLKILSSVSIEVFPSDKMPSLICDRCKIFMEASYEFKRLCRQADASILEFVKNGKTLESVAWPTLLKKMLTHIPSKQVSVVKTLVDGGTTVQVTSQEGSDSEDEDDENVYNIKLQQDSDEETKDQPPCIKVLASNEKPEVKQINEGFSTIPKLAKHVRTHVGVRAYPCKFCDKSFVKSHHYTRHLRLKHSEINRNSRGPFGEQDLYRCDQCEDTFTTQDELIYHSAVHATQNLTCPLCQEKFGDVDAVTAHIKSHVNGTEFMCDYCELVFTSKDKLDFHVINKHEEESQNEQSSQNESSMDMEDDDDEEDINVKEDGDQMVVEITNLKDYMLKKTQKETEEKANNTGSEESEIDAYVEMTADIWSSKDPKVLQSDIKETPLDTPDLNENVNTTVTKKEDETKFQATQMNTDAENVSAKKPKEIIIGGASDKSLRLLEKELQELKRTTNRNEVKNAKPMETLKSRRLQLHTSTPKSRIIEDKKSQPSTKTPISEKRMPERRTIITKENKEPKEIKTNSSIKEDKDVKERDTPKTVSKNNSTDKDDGVRRSSRPSKIKDYAKMIRDRTQEDGNDEDGEDESEEEDEPMKESPPEPRQRTKRSSIKATPKPPVRLQAENTPPTQPRKRGRPRKDQSIIPAKVKKDLIEQEEDQEKSKLVDPKVNSSSETQKTLSKDTEPTKLPEAVIQKSAVIMSPTGQTLKKVPVKALPPGVKPLPLPANARPVGTGELCEMQIGKKMVKVQKIVMTKAEVEAMAKKGLVEMKDGTMVLKQGIKLPSTVREETAKESPTKNVVPTPTRCVFDEDS